MRSSRFRIFLAADVEWHACRSTIEVPFAAALIALFRSHYPVLALEGEENESTRFS
jgi:hypothetical protein